MNASVPGSAPVRVVSSPSAEVLREITDATTVAVIWRRTVDERIARDIGPRLPATSSERGCLAWAYNHHALDLTPLLADLEACEGREALRADMRRLLDCWFETSPAAHAFVSLTVVADSACQKLHVDRVGRRLLATYVGAGTEWLEPHDADAWRRDRCCWKATSLRRVERGHVLLFKGSADDDERGLVHRSPPREPGAGARLLFRICDGEYHLLRELGRMATAGSPS